MTTNVLAHLSLPGVVFANPAASVLLPVALGAAVGYSTKPDPKDRSVRAIRQPPFRPPPAAFGPTWTALYALTGYAAHRAFRTLGPDPAPSVPAGLYSLQLGLNLAWMPLFFVLRQPVAAAADAVTLLGINVFLAVRWLRSTNPSTRTVGYLWLPYVGWLAFATYLSVGVGHLNGWSFRPAKKSSTSPPPPPSVSSSSAPSRPSRASSSSSSPSSSSAAPHKDRKGKGRSRK
ncbi:benzodiazepine receptor family protein [Grosmannia clavigera kw1407]|uniref:Benzodiazepine receptor family protein n=1 Tax=Grosmannia clavigera (strain kw1407 / UAMH 11150) TaxID=655863 RepID=F0XKL1_GROCL|nr:benzodiazepine receptor family protein [Grosmannia clavigera kw1407]EFX01813.1 benzodiazepine receptor family protein [Grosmannia clavigera kw1407]